MRHWVSHPGPPIDRIHPQMLAARTSDSLLLKRVLVFQARLAAPAGLDLRPRFGPKAATANGAVSHHKNRSRLVGRVGNYPAGHFRNKQGKSGLYDPRRLGRRRRPVSVAKQQQFRFNRPLRYWGTPNSRISETQWQLLLPAGVANSTRHPISDCASEGKTPLIRTVLFNWLARPMSIMRTVSSFARQRSMRDGEKTVSSYSRGPDGAITKVDDDYFNSMGQLHGHQEARMGGTRIDTAYDAANAATWSVDAKIYDAGGRLDWQRTDYDPAAGGHRAKTDYDQTNIVSWSADAKVYDAGGRLDWQRTDYDNRTATLRDWDQAGGATWNIQDTAYDNAGRLDARNTHWDTGALSANDWDQSGLVTWSLETTNYDSAGRLDARNTHWDTGALTVNDWDQANAGIWSQEVTAYDNAGRLNARNKPTGTTAGSLPATGTRPGRRPGTSWTRPTTPPAVPTRRTPGTTPAPSPSATGAANWGGDLEHHGHGLRRRRPPRRAEHLARHRRSLRPRLGSGQCDGLEHHGHCLRQCRPARCAETQTTTAAPTVSRIGTRRA